MTDLKDLLEKTLAEAQEERACVTDGCGEKVKGPPGAKCPACHRKAETEAHNAATAEVVRQVRRTLPTRFCDVDFWTDAGVARLKSRIRVDVFRAARSYVGEGRGAVVRGSSARGKTTLAAAMLVSHARRLTTIASVDEDVGEGPEWDAARSCRYLRAHDLVYARIQNPAGRGEAPIVLDAKFCPVIIIDDLGTEPPPTRDRVMVEVLLDRLDNERPTIITTTRTDEELVERYGEGPARRILHDPISSLIEMGLE